jgi:NitT/TauT family transport system permease protein
VQTKPDRRVGEFVAADSGVGFRIKEATSFFNTGAVFAGLLLPMVISMTLLGMLKLIERRVLRWQTADTLNMQTLESS